ncbi:MAG TPA: hypothetical protein VGL06_07365 [Pseudonocardiaceae bacterium]
MEDDFHTRLAAELDNEPEPPLGDLVGNALRQGRRLRLVRRTTTYAVGTLVVTGVLITGLIVGGRAGRHAPPAAVGTAHSGLSIAKSPGPRSPITSAAIVYRLKQLLPPGPTSDYGRAGTGTGFGTAFGTAFGQIAVDRGHGPGMVRLHVGTLPIPYHCGSHRDATLTIQCATLPDGAQLAIMRFSDDCNQSLVADVYRSNGVNVLFDVTTCLTSNGTANPPALSVTEAVAIADDPSWGPTMDSALVAAAQQEFPDLPRTFNN